MGNKVTGVNVCDLLDTIHCISLYFSSKYVMSRLNYVHNFYYYDK